MLHLPSLEHTAPAPRLESDDPAIVAEQIRLLLHPRADLPVNLINAGIVTVTIGPLYPAWLVFVWLALFCGVILVRSVIRQHYRIAAPGIKSAKQWGRIFTLNALATGALWGLTGSVVLVTQEPLYHVFIVFVLGGMMAGGIVSNSAYLPAVRAFMLPTIVPVILLLASRGELIPLEMGAMLGVFAAVLLVTGRNINRSIIENFKLRIGQSVLLAARQEAEEKLQFANLLLNTQMEASLDGVLVVDANSKIVSFNQRFADIWHLTAADVAGGADQAVLQKISAAVEDREYFLARVQYLYAHPGEDSREDLKTVDGRFLDRYTVTLCAPDKTYLGRAWFFRDVSARKQAEALALRMARFDTLTGLANRSVFVEALQRAIASARRSDAGFAIIYLDLDRFKDVNDTLGHPIGDELLKGVAARLRANTREIDTVARFGGDEFAIVVAHTTDPAAAAIVAEKLLQAIAAPFSVNGNDIHSAASIGIATYGADTPDAEALLAHADLALYQAKTEGRGTYRFFTAAMDHEVRTRVARGTALRGAVDAGQLFLLYQPQVFIDTGRIAGVEALVRWRHPEQGVLGPEVFIPIAEQIGIIGKLGRWVLDEACRQAKVWCDAGIALGRVSVNVSFLQLKTPLLLEADIAAALTQTGLPPHLLELELTESGLMVTAREHSEVIQRILKTGVTVAIDDFGTGYLSLDYLRTFPTNRIKIARAFIKNLETAPANATLVKAIIGIARELGIRVIAAGVETQQQARLLRQWGCEEVQGYLFAAPLDVEAITLLLHQGTVSPGVAPSRKLAVVIPS